MPYPPEIPMGGFLEWVSRTTGKGPLRTRVAIRGWLRGPENVPRSTRCGQGRCPGERHTVLVAADEGVSPAHVLYEKSVVVSACSRCGHMAARAVPIPDAPMATGFVLFQGPPVRRSGVSSEQIPTGVWEFNSWVLQTDWPNLAGSRIPPNFTAEYALYQMGKYHKNHVKTGGWPTERSRIPNCPCGASRFMLVQAPMRDVPGTAGAPVAEEKLNAVLEDEFVQRGTAHPFRLRDTDDTIYVFACDRAPMECGLAVGLNK